MFDIVFEGLLSAYKSHVALGQSGKVKDKKNRFGDMALRGDIDAEERILSSLDKFAEKNDINIICKSEELGENNLNESGKEIYFAVFDGLDGSSNYLNPGKWGYGTMLSIAKGKNPTYDDFLVAGIAKMDEEKIVIAEKGRGVSLFDVKSSKKAKISPFDPNEVYEHSKILVNKAFPEEISAIGKNSDDWPMTGSTAASIFTICTDKKYQGLFEVTRKNNLEQPILYVMITTLGGVMVDKNGKSIGSNDFLSWGQKNGDGSEDRQILVTARNKKIADGLLGELDMAAN